MTDEEIFQTWAPEASIWSPWAKPVLFAHLTSRPEEVPAPAALPDGACLPAADASLAVILDLPGDEGVWVGLALAARGYRPVPLYNAVPMPALGSINEPLALSQTVVKVVPIISAIIQASESLAAKNLPATAPPAFILDANRQAPGHIVRTSEFDNRSVCFTTDFPSANFLAAQGIKRVLLIQPSRSPPQTDLAHVLRRWQDASLQLEQMDLGGAGSPETLFVPQPSWFGAMFQRALTALGLRRANGLGFGGWPADSAGGG